VTTKKRSQVIDLLVHVAALLGVESDRDLADLAGVSVDNIDNWKSGASQELKGQTLTTVKDALTTRVRALEERARLVDSELGIVGVEVEETSGPSAMQRQFHDRLSYDYLGHRFLYFEAHGAIAWENLMKGGYDQRCWLAGVEQCAAQFFETQKDGPVGTIAKALGLRRGSPRGLDLISFGPGEASKEALVLKRVLAEEENCKQRLAWLQPALVDVSVPLLLKGAKACRALLADRGEAVLAFCADFEEGPLSFAHRLHDDGVRVLCMLGNVFGNVRDEEVLVRERVSRILRPGDFLWIEVATRLERVEDDPLYSMTKNPEGELTAPEANRRLLLEGPYRRWEAASGRRPTDIVTRVFLREGDDTACVPGSVNFCHDLVFKEERRACTMLYSRRYDLAHLATWFERWGYEVCAVVPVDDSMKRARVAHMLVRRR
jgi:uncharacterized SAM-dependent methyltransferase